MPKRAQIATREYLEQIPLPTWATTYTVITHETVIVNALEQLKLKGFTVETERYRANNRGEVAVGMYELKYENDPELGMLFAWTNSYDKSVRFKCSVGGFVRVSGSAIINADYSWGRKHTGTADQEMISQVADQVSNGQIYYNELLLVKDAMKKVQLNRHIVSEFLGRAFFQRGLFSKEQISIVRDELLKPSFDYNSDKDSLWTTYNHMLVALKSAHPRSWLDEQRELHKYVCKEFMIVPSTATTTTNNVGPAAVIQIAQQIVEKHIEEAITNTLHEIGTNTKSYPPKGTPEAKMNMEELAEIKQDSKFKKTITSPDVPASELKPATGVPFLDDITPEEQKLIDERMAMLTGGKTEAADLNLPD